MQALRNDNMILNLGLNMKFKLLPPLRTVTGYANCRAAKHIYVEDAAIRQLRFFIVKRETSTGF